MAASTRSKSAGASPNVSSPLDSVRNAGWAAVSAAFGSLGRFCMALDGEFLVLHTSERLDELLGADLFGPDGALRQALMEQRKCEGWRATLRLEPDGFRLVSVMAAPLPPRSARPPSL